MKKDKDLLEITNRIYIIRDQKVMLDRDLAELYRVEVRAINQAVKRNQERKFKSIEKRVKDIEKKLK